MDNESQKTNPKDEIDKNETNKKIENINEEENTTKTVSNIKPKEDIKKEVVVNYRKPSIFSCILLILIGVLIATIIFLVIYFFKINNDDVKIYSDLIDSTINIPEINNDENENINLQLSPTSDLVIALYAKIPMQIRGYEPYSGQKVTKDSISDNNKLLFTLRSLEKESKFISLNATSDILSKLDNKMQGMGEYLKDVKRFNIEDVNQKYKSIFGSSQEVPLIDAETTLGYVYEYVPEDNCYYGHSYAGGGGQDFNYKSQIYACEQSKDESEIYIYDNFIAFNSYYTSDNSYNNFALYSNSDCENIVVDLERKYENGNTLYNGKTYDEIMNEYIDQGGKFKHTFKLDDSGNYYWYSSEQI